jgi:hypothetical protein
MIIDPEMIIFVEKIKMEKFTIADSRYKSIKERSFNTLLEYFLLYRIKNNQPIDYNDEFKEAFIDFISGNRINERNEIMRIYHELWQLSKDADTHYYFPDYTMGELDKKIKSWYKENDVKDLLVSFEKEHFMSIAEFREIYGHDEKERACVYCGLKESDVHNLLKNKSLFTKRYYSRGHTMEVDRRIPNEEYKDGNIVLCCYWCNNAKTDEFTFEEFMEIGESIKLVWQNRLIGCK